MTLVSSLGRVKKNPKKVLKGEIQPFPKLLRGIVNKKLLSRDGKGMTPA